MQNTFLFNHTRESVLTNTATSYHVDQQEHLKANIRTCTYSQKSFSYAQSLYQVIAEDHPAADNQGRHSVNEQK
jgi:hypothetical protein